MSNPFGVIPFATQGLHPLLFCNMTPASAALRVRHQKTTNLAEAA